MSVQILVVDDSLPMRSVIKKTIKASGFGANFYEASNGNQALEILRIEWLDLVITDYNMPDMDGLELISKIKNDEILKTIPILMLTTEGSKQKISEFLSKGATAYIKKPFTPEAIKAKLNEIIGDVKDDACIDESNEVFDF